jgi:hypothetical protein
VSPLLLTILAFVAVVTVCMCAYSIYADLFLRDQSRVSRRIDEQLRQEQRELARKSLLFKDLSGRPAMPEAGR